MAGQNASGNESAWGAVDVVTDDNRVQIVGGAGRVTRTRYTWRPPPATADLPDGFVIDVLCLTGPDGIRRFAPAEHIEDFLLKAALAGFARLVDQPGLTREQRFAYNAMRLLFQKAGGLREHLGRAFDREVDLYVTGASGGDRHVLPPDLGLDCSGQGTAWGPKELIAHGRAAVVAVGDTNPTPAVCIHLGLLAAARRNPFDVASLSRAACLGIVRLGLFDLSPLDGTLDAEVLRVVEERLWAGLECHVDDSTDDFRRWFFEKTDNLVHRIAKAKKEGGRLSGAAVRHAVLDLVFKAYQYLGDCVDVFVTAFAAALPIQLDRHEWALFDATYRRQPYIGGLPLVLLQARFPIIREAVLDLWDAPHDADRAGTLLRLLDYYGRMTQARREGDHQKKKRGQARNKTGGIARDLPIDGDRDSRPDPKDAKAEGDPFQAIAARLRQGRNVFCGCGLAAKWLANVEGDDPLVDPARIANECSRCGFHRTIAATREEIRTAVASILAADE